MNPRAALVVLVLFAALLRGVGHLNSGLWFDEIWTLVDFGRLDVVTLITTYGSDNNHPLYTLLAWTSLHTFGESAWALRLPAVIFGALGVGALWRFARAVASPPEAWLATGLLMVSYHHVWFSQNARGYTALLFFTIVSTHYFIRALDGDDRAWWKYAIAIALGTYTHMTGVFVAMAHAAIWFAAWRGWVQKNTLKRPLLGIVVAPTMSLILHAPILVEMVTFLVPKPGGARVKVESSWTNPWWTITAVAESLGLGLVVGLVVLGGAALVLGVGTASWWRRDRRLAIAFLLPGLIGGVVMLGLGRNLWPRFFFFLAGFILLIVVRGCFALANYAARYGPTGRKVSFERALLIGGSAVLIIGSLVILPRAYLLPKQDYEGAMRWVQDERGRDDAVLTTGLTRMPYKRYYEAPFDPIASVADLDFALLSHERVLVLHTLPTYLESRQPELFAALMARSKEIARFEGTVGAGDIVVLALTRP